MPRKRAAGAPEEVRAHPAFEQLQEKYSALFDQASDAIVLWNLDMKITAVNRKAEELSGLKRKHLVGQSILSVLEEDSVKDAVQYFRSMLKDGTPTPQHNLLIKCAEGVKIGEVSSAPIIVEGKTVGFQTVIRDVTEQSRRQKALQESEEKLRAMFDSVADGITVADLDGNILDMNKAALAMYGCKKREEVVGRKGFEFLSETDLDKAKRTMASILTEGAISGIEYTAVKMDGTEYPIETSAALIRDMEGNPVGLVSVAKDITHRNQADQDLKESEERFRTIFDNAMDGIVLAEFETKKFYTANRAFCEMLGYMVEEIRHIGVHDIHPKKDLNYVLKQFERQYRKEITLAEDIPVLRKDGRVIHADINSTPVALNGKEYLMGIFRDVTIRKEMEKRLLQSQKLESLGMFAAGLVHDFKEYLSKVFGLASYLRNSLDAKSSNYRRVIELAGAAQGVSELVDRLNMFAGQTIINPTLMSIDAPVNETLRVLRRYIRPNVTIDVSLDARPGTVKADYWQIEKAILNVLTNACDAMPSGGTLKVRTKEKDIGDKMLRANPWMKSGKYVIISISDTGTGISRKILDRIFDPFFTTKGPGKGAGLGLSIAYGIVKDHKGTIDVRSTVGKGSRFDIYLPVT